MSTFRTNLKTLEALEWPRIQRAISDLARTDMGREMCLHWGPGMDSNAATQMSGAILELIALKKSQNVSLPVGDIPDPTKILQRITRSGAILTQEFFQLIRFLKGAQGLHHFVSGPAKSCVLLHKTLPWIDLMKDWTDVHYPMLDAHGEMVDDASQDLLALRHLSRDLKEQIEKRLADYVKNPKFTDLLQDYYITVRDGRYVLPVKTSFKTKIAGIIHDVSHSEQTTFIEPQEVVDWNNQLKVTEREIEREIEAILKTVVERTKPHVAEFEKNLAIIAKADLLASSALYWEQVALNTKSSLSSVTWGLELNFSKLIHPLLHGSNVVSNNVSWKGALVLTGPNTGGKTVILKSVGLAACCAWAGMPVTADSAELPAGLSGLWADIGDEQSLEKELSTFSAHLMNLKDILDQVKADDLVLIDEIATGTSPEEGQPLAQAYIEELLDLKANVLVTTHYGDLKHFAMSDSRARIAAMMVDSKTKKPSYQLILDIPGESSAFTTAKNIGFNDNVLKRAQKLRGHENQDLSLAVQKLDEARQNFMKREEEVKQEIEKARMRELKALERQREYEQKDREGLSQEAKKTVSEFQKIRDELSQLVKNASLETLSKGATDLFVKIADTARTVSDTVVKRESTAAIENIKDLKLGDLVEVQNLGVGEVVSESQKGKVEIKIGEMRLWVTLDRLSRASAQDIHMLKTQRQSQAAAMKRKSTLTSSTAASDISSVCDVRGMNVNEAMRRMESSLNAIAYNSNSTVTIIHGHGAEKLKEAIRNYLMKTRDDLKFRSGSWPGEGGDGVTIVEANIE